MQFLKKYSANITCNKYVLILFFVQIAAPLWLTAQDSQPTNAKVAELVAKSLGFRNKNIDSCLYFAQKATQIATQTAQSHDLSDALYVQTVANYVNSNYVNALNYASQGLDICSKYNYVNKSINFLNEVALIYYELHDNHLALKYYFEALKIADSQSNLEAKAIIYNNIGMVKLPINTAEGISYINKSLKIYLDKKDEIGIANAYTNLGKAFIGLDSLEKALVFFEKSLPIYNKYQDYWGKSTCYQNIGKIYTYKKQSETAYANYKQALEMAQVLASNELIAMSQNGLALNSNDNIEAENLATQALQTGKNLHIPAVLRDANKALAGIYEKNKRYDLAYYHQSQYKNLLSQIYNSENSEQLIALNLEQQADKQRTKNAQLNKDSLEYDKKTTITTVILGAALLIVFVMSFLFFYWKKQLKNITKINKELEETKEAHQENAQDLSSNTEVKNQLFYHLSSSLKNPLSTMYSVLNMYNSNEIKEEELQMFSKALRGQIKKTIIFLDSLLFWVRQSIHKDTHLDTQATFLDEAIDDALAFLQPLTEIKNIAIKSHLQTNTGISTAQGAANIIVRNLLFNCVEYGIQNSLIEIHQQTNLDEHQLSVSIICKITNAFKEKVAQKILEQNNALSSYEISYAVANFLIDKNKGGISVVYPQNGSVVEIRFSLPKSIDK